MCGQSEASIPIHLVFRICDSVFLFFCRFFVPREIFGLEAHDASKMLQKKGRKNNQRGCHYEFSCTNSLNNYLNKYSHIYSYLCYLLDNVSVYWELSR